MKKTIHKKLFGSILAALMISICVPYIPFTSGNITTDVQAASPKLSSSKLTLSRGQSHKLRMKNTKKKVVWRSSRKSVASVSKNGTIKAKNTGTATITAKIGKKKYKCQVTVITKKKAALKAYAKILRQKKYANESNDISKCHFAVSDLNADGIPELLIASDFNILSINKYYTYANGKAVTIKQPNRSDAYPVWGTLYTMPSRKSFALFRGGPAVENVMPYTLLEYKIINRRIKLVNSAACNEYFTGGKKYYLNGKTCSAKTYNKINNARKASIDLAANSKANRRKSGVK